MLGPVYPGVRGVCMGKFSPSLSLLSTWMDSSLSSPLKTALCSILTHTPASTVPMFISSPLNDLFTKMQLKPFLPAQHPLAYRCLLENTQSSSLDH